MEPYPTVSLRTISVRKLDQLAKSKGHTQQLLREPLVLPLLIKMISALQWTHWNKATQKRKQEERVVLGKQEKRKGGIMTDHSQYASPVDNSIP